MPVTYQLVPLLARQWPNMLVPLLARQWSNMLASGRPVSPAARSPVASHFFPLLNHYHDLLVLIQGCRAPQLLYWANLLNHYHDLLVLILQLTNPASLYQDGTIRTSFQIAHTLGFCNML